MEQKEDTCVKSKSIVVRKKDHLYFFSYGYPKNFGNYYGGNQFQNFRDFADLKKQKGERRRFF